MKSGVILVVGIMLLSTSLVVAISTPPTPEMLDRLYTHDIIGEYGTATWCGYCKYAHGALRNIYAGGWHPFYYISLVTDKNTHASARATELGISGIPDVHFDGSYRNNVGAGSVPGAQAAYNTSIVACGNRAVPDVDLVISVDWYGSANMDVTATVYYNGTGTYSARLRVYVCELISSFGWTDTGGHLYTFPFLDYAFNQQISVPSGTNWSSTYYWNGASHNNGYGQNFGSVDVDNTMVIGAIFNTGSGYVDDTFGYRVGSNRPPDTPSSPQPSNGATNVGLGENLEWTGGDPDWFDTVSYDVYFEANDPSPDVLVANDITDPFYDPGTLPMTTTYYWQIVAQDNNGASTTGPVWSFTTRGNTPPNVPSDPNPFNGETEVNVHKNLDWTGGDPENDPVTYDVYFGNMTPPPIIEHNVTQSEYTLDMLDFNTTYYWMIRAWDSFGETTTGPAWSFTTSDEPNVAPTNPEISGKTNIRVQTEYEFTFVSTDSNGDEIYYYVTWGDGTISEEGPYTSGEPAVITHSWESKGDFTIMAKAKDPYDLESGWGSFEITVPMSYNSNPSTVVFGFFPRISEDVIRFWYGSWQQISVETFQGYNGKILLFGKVF